MEELLNNISAHFSGKDYDPIWISVIDLGYVHGQMRLASENSKHCNFAVTDENMNSFYRLLEGFYGVVIPTFFQEKLDRTLGQQTPVW